MRIPPSFRRAGIVGLTVVLGVGLAGWVLLPLYLTREINQRL